MKTRARTGKAFFWLAAFFLASLPALRAEETMRLSSPAFENSGEIPKEFTCDGNNAAPPLEWSGQPAGTQSFAILGEDLSAPTDSARWVIARIPPTVFNLPKGLPALAILANSELQGKNDLGKLGYSGPCPDAGATQSYSFTVFALDIYLGMAPDAAAEELLRAMEGHILARGTLKGKYRREKNTQAV